MEKCVTFKVRKQQVVGMLHLPDDRSSPVPAVVMLHGFRGNKSESHRIFVKLARALASSGIASLRIDFRGSGDSEGDFSRMTVMGEVKDAKAAVKFLRKRKEVDAERIGILGLSMGGMVAAYALSEDPTIKAGALWSAVANAPASAERKFEPQFAGQFKEMGVCDMHGWAVGQEFASELVTLKPTEVITNSTAPILLVHGTEDDTVPYGDALIYEKSLRESGGNVVLHPVAGADHTYNSLQWETEVLSVTLDWFKEKLACRS